MNKLFKHEQGASHLVAILAVLIVAIVGVVYLRVSNAYVWPGRKSLLPTQTINKGNYVNTGANATCTANGNPGTVVNGVCRATSPSTPGVSNTSNTTVTGSSSASGANGTTTCTVNGTTYTSTTGSCNATSTSNNGQPVCTVNGETVPCQ